MDIKHIFRNLYNRAKSSSFLKSVLTLSSGVIIAQIINFLGMPAVGRLYDPAAIGDYTLITANAAIISAVACLGMMTSFMLPAKDAEARGLSRLVTYSTLLITTVVIAALWLCSGVYCAFDTEQTPYSVSLLVLWLYIVAYTISNICYAYVNRRKLYRVMFWNPVITAGINVGCGIVFGFLGWGFVGYTAAHILSFVVNIIHLAYHANPYEKIDEPEYRCIPLLRNYSRFPVYQMPANLASSLSSQLPVKIIQSLYSTTELGLYSMALRILSLPTTLLATPINRVFFQEANARHNRGENIGEFCYKILETNVKLAVLPIGILIVFGRPIFSIFLGSEWREAGYYAAILGVYQMMLFCSSCLAGDFVIIKKNSWNLVSALVSLMICAVLYLFCRFVMPMSVIMYLVALSVLMTAKIIAAQSVLFLYLGTHLRKYLLLVVKWVLIPCAAAFALTSLIGL